MSATAEHPPEPVDDNRVSTFRVYIIVSSAITWIATALRFWSRALYVPHDRQSHRFWWDDWTALAAMLAFTSQLILTLLLLDNGFGRHAWALPEPQLVLVLKYVYAIYFIYTVNLALSKASALLFLSRVFPHHSRIEWFNIVVLITHALNIAWLIGFVIATILQCHPIEKNWKPWVQGTCSPTVDLCLVSAIPSVSIDPIILILPLPKVWRLHTTISRKCAVTFIFALGYGVIVASLGRLITVFKESKAIDADFSNTGNITPTNWGLDIFYWAWAETPITMIGISLPATLHLAQYLNNAYLKPLASNMHHLQCRGILRGKIWSTNNIQEVSRKKMDDPSYYYIPSDDYDVEASAWSHRSMSDTRLACMRSEGCQVEEVTLPSNAILVECRAQLSHDNC
ncbi:hypothetical protein F5Y10DRAFT_243596 [Nemania abortiva]|nr:hypothetical protein F5Y10DRAFT_243596 [Nemania abortiva]